MELTQWFWIKPRRLVRALFRRRDLESELDEELQHYISLQTEQLVADGMAPEQARLETMRALGGIEQVKEECRDARGVRFLEDLGRDTGYALRSLWKNPAFAFGAIALLALAIAANVMVASMINTLFFDTIPFSAPQQLVAVSQEFPTLGSGGLKTPFSLPEVTDLDHGLQTVEHMAGFRYTRFNATGADGTERIQGATVSPNLFTVLGIAPLSGEVFDSDRLHGARVDGVVISERLWRRFYAADPALVGKQILLDHRLRTVLGIMPAAFEFPLPAFGGGTVQSGRADIWQAIIPTEAEIEDRGLAREYEIVARLKMNSGLPELNRELALLGSSWKHRYGSIYQAGSLHLEAAPLRPAVGARMKSASVILSVAVLLVWLISAANLIAMLLARAAAARQQMAIRMALGAGPMRLLRQAMSEGLVLATLGCGAGILLGIGGVVSLRGASAQSPLVGHLHVNANVMFAAIALLVITALSFGLVPGIYSVRRATVDALTHGRGGAGLRPLRLQNHLVMGETALALVLLVGAGLLVKSLLRLQNVYPGFKAEGVVTMEISLPETKYPDAEAAAKFFSRVAEDVAHLPGVSSAAFVSFLPFGGSTTDSSFTIENHQSAGRPSPPDEEIRIVTPDYFSVLDIPVLNGRVFTSSDGSESPLAVVVNKSLALRYWGIENVVGKRIKLDYPRNIGWREIVGVVGDIKHIALDAPAEPELYIPHTQLASRRMVLTARTVRTTEDAIAMIRETVQSIDPRQPIANPRTLRQAIADSILPRRFTAGLVAVFAAIGLLLAAAGIYAVISYSTTERRHEIAVRMAIGANHGEIIAMVLKESGRLLFAGTMIGFVVAVGASLMLKPTLYQVSAFDPVMLLSMLGFLTLCGLAAAYIPARRATRHNLALALAHD